VAVSTSSGAPEPDQRRVSCAPRQRTRRWKGRCSRRGCRSAPGGRLVDTNVVRGPSSNAATPCEVVERLASNESRSPGRRSEEDAVDTLIRNHWAPLSPAGDSNWRGGDMALGYLRKSRMPFTLNARKTFVPSQSTAMSRPARPTFIRQTHAADGNPDKAGDRPQPAPGRDGLQGMGLGLMAIDSSIGSRHDLHGPRTRCPRTTAWNHEVLGPGEDAAHVAAPNRHLSTSSSSPLIPAPVEPTLALPLHNP